MKNKVCFKAWWRAQTNSAAWRLTHWPPGGRRSCRPSPRDPPRACSRCDGARRWCTCCCSRRTGTPSHPAHDTCGTPQPPALHTHTRTYVRRRGLNKDDSFHFSGGLNKIFVIYRTGDKFPMFFASAKFRKFFMFLFFDYGTPKNIGKNIVH